ncbi:MAG: CU044_2847 family protein [Acidobacteriota bacterium]
MAEIVELQFQGGSMGIELSPDDTATSRGLGDEVQRVAQTFDEALDGLRGLANSLHNTVAGMVSRPETVTVEFGLSIKASGKFVIASAEGTANLKVVMQWKTSATAPGKP